MPRSIFLSYSSKDKAIADMMCKALEKNGLNCWIAPRDIMPGQDWSEAIIDGLTSAKVFVLVLSETSNVSEQVKREIQNAVSEGLTIVPFRIDDVVLTKHMRYFIGTPHWLDAFTQPVEPHLDRLVEVVGALLRSRVPGIAADVPIGLPSPKPITTREHAPETHHYVAAPEAVAPPKPVCNVSPEEISFIKNELAAFVGPISSVMVTREVAQATDKESLCLQLSRYLSSPEETRRFLEAVKKHSVKPNAAPENSASSPTPEVVWNQDELRLVERQFAEFMGPLASVILKRTLVHASNMEELYGLLSEKMDSPSDRERFLRLRKSK